MCKGRWRSPAPATAGAQGSVVGQQLGAQVDSRQGHQEAGQQGRQTPSSRTRNARRRPGTAARSGSSTSGYWMEIGVPCNCGTVAQGQPAEQRDVFEPCQLAVAVRAMRALDHDPGWRRIVEVGLPGISRRRVATAIPAVAASAGSPHCGSCQPAGQARGGIAEAGVRAEECHLETCPAYITVIAILKIGRCYGPPRSNRPGRR